MLIRDSVPLLLIIKGLLPLAVSHSVTALLILKLLAREVTLPLVLLLGLTELSCPLLVLRSGTVFLEAHVLIELPLAFSELALPLFVLLLLALDLLQTVAVLGDLLIVDIALSTDLLLPDIRHGLRGIGGALHTALQHIPGCSRLLLVICTVGRLPFLTIGIVEGIPQPVAGVFVLDSFPGPHCCSCHANTLLCMRSGL